MTETPLPDLTNPRTRELCGTMDVHRRLMTESITYQERRALIENRAMAYESQARGLARTGLVTIPVVVHVVHHPDEPSQNVSEAQIHSQLEVLNQDFRAGNADASKVPAVWKDRVADCNIEFRLASQDPDGNSTEGITRTESTKPSFSTDRDDVKSSATGGADPWPSDDYLNVWVCGDLRDSIGRSILGYAQFPGGPPSTDGVVIANWCFGTEGSAQAPFDLGRTATHEVGHWLDLRHIWGDDRGSCSGSDLVSDTPNQADPTFGKPTFPQFSCNNGPDGNMFMNYMDYTDDDAMFMFTPGQSRRMAACLEGARASLLTAPVFALSATGAETPVAVPPRPEAAPQAAPAAAGQAGDGELQALRDEVERLREDYRQLTSLLDGIRAALNGEPAKAADRQ
ncbi:zinc metalloprotease [Arthrobacter ginkgonis]|uniref:Zinc metalloprotease n=1 Tax=Arthrobacter ginkgonis TaxID=1630594 RepID=A0ABP7CGR6_9MICC